MKKQETERFTILIILTIIILIFLYSIFELREKINNYKQLMLSSETDISVSETDGITEEAFVSSEPPQKGYTYYDILLPYELQEYTQDLCVKHNADLELIFAIMNTESGFNQTASNGKCHGLMQIHSSSAMWFSSEYGLDIKNVYGNIEAGIIIYKMYEKEYKSQNKALIRYNSTSKYANSLFNKGITENRYTDKVYKNLEYVRSMRIDDGKEVVISQTNR